MSVVIQPGFLGVDYPLDHPRIGWQSLGGTVGASSEAPGFPAVGAQDPRTFTAWRPTSIPATWALTFPGLRPIQYIGIAAHNLGSSGIEVRLQVPDGAGGWVNIPGVANVPFDDSPIMFLLNLAGPNRPNAIRIRLQDPGGAQIPTIGHIRVGSVLELPQRAQFTGTPITESRQIEYEFNQSQTGEFLGQTVKRRGLLFNAEINHLSEEWASGPYLDFRNHADSGQPFFYAARPLKYPEEVAYCMADGMVMAERSIPNRNVSRSLTMRLRGYQRNG